MTKHWGWPAAIGVSPAPLTVGDVGPLQPRSLFSTLPSTVYWNLQELPPEVAQVPSPRVLDASDNRLEAVPPLAPSLQRLVLSNNRLASVAGLEALSSLKVRARAAVPS